MRRIVITGLGAVAPNGLSSKETWESTLAGNSGISLIRECETSDLPVKIGGEVKNFQLSENILPTKEQSRFDRFTLFAVKAAWEALESAGLDKEGDCYPPHKMGCILGVGMGGFPVVESQYNNLFKKGPRRVSPFFIPAIIPNMSSGLLSIIKKFQGVNYSIASACASASHAIGMAALEIKSGRQDVVITGGAEAAISRISIAGFANMKALSRWNDRPKEASRPFDLNRNGFVMGEGSGVLVLENLESALKRGAPIYAELLGDGYSSDAHHITAPHPEGQGAVLAMNKALEYSQVKPEQIDYINAHGTSTHQGDIVESLAIKKVFGKHAMRPYVSSTKSMTGHLLGAAGGIESIFCIMALKTGKIPPTINLNEPDTDCELNHVSNQSVESDVRYALNNSFGFGGTNASIIFKRWQFLKENRRADQTIGKNRPSNF